jgi:hypothetical protein
MHKSKSYTAYYEPVPLRFWFYVWVVLLLFVIIYNIVRLIWPPANASTTWEFFLTPIAHGFIFYSTAERLYKQYQNSKIQNCFIRVDDDGICWCLHQGNYNVKEAEIIVWADVKKIVIAENRITVKYMDTYFSDHIPLEKISEENRVLLMEVLHNQIQERSIPFENRLLAA